jgi:hypothetical protein
MKAELEQSALGPNVLECVYGYMKENLKGLRASISPFLKMRFFSLKVEINIYLLAQGFTSRFESMRARPTYRGQPVLGFRH